MRRWKLSTQLTMLLLFCGCLAAGGYYRFCTAEGMLARYGVGFNPDAVNYASVNLNTACFWFDGPGGRLEGPEVTGDLLVVETPHRTPDGQVEFAVRTEGYSQNNRVWIQLVLPPKGAQAFHIVQAEHPKLRVRYPIEGYTGIRAPESSDEE